MHSYHKEATVGAIVLLGLIVFIGGSLWLSGKTWNKSGLVPVMYENIGNLKQGAPVRISGAPIGRVEGIHYQDVGKVLVTLKIDRKRVTPTTTATAEILSVGMLGDAVIDLNPGTGTPITDADTLRGTLGKGDLMEMGAKLADKAGVTMDALNRMLDTTLIINLKQTLSSTNRFMNYLADANHGPTAELNNTMRTFQRTGARLDSTLSALDLKGLQGNISTTMRSADSTMRTVSQLTTQLTQTTKTFDAMLSDIRSGKGTLGKLANDSTLYLQIVEVTKSLTKLVDELAKNPGKIGITIKIP